jgi:hypothetical protein
MKQLYGLSAHQASRLKRLLSWFEGSGGGNGPGRGGVRLNPWHRIRGTLVASTSTGFNGLSSTAASGYINNVQGLTGWNPTTSSTVELEFSNIGFRVPAGKIVKAEQTWNAGSSSFEWELYAAPGMSSTELETQTVITNIQVNATGSTQGPTIEKKTCQVYRPSTASESTGWSVVHVGTTCGST